MARKLKLTSRVVIEYLDMFPNAKNLTLARLIYKENPSVFTSVEHARGLIRMYKGSQGNQNREEVKFRKFYSEPGDPNPYSLPDSHAEDLGIFIIPKQYNRILVLSDLHVPYHDVASISGAIKYGVEFGVNCVLINGDGIDAHQLSRYEKDPRKRSFADEIQDMRKVLQALSNQFGKVYYKRGNHELRYDRYMLLKAPELLGIASFEFDNIMGFHEFNCEYVIHPIIKAGKLPIVHGHEFQSKATSQVNPARGLFLKANRSAMVSHSHRVSTHTETDIEGKLITTYSTGCLCGLSPEWAELNKWTHGCATITVADDGAYVVDNKRIYRGELL